MTAYEFAEKLQTLEQKQKDFAKEVSQNPDKKTDYMASTYKVVLAKIYPARETDTLGISSDDLRKEIEKRGTEVYYFPEFEEIEKFLSTKCINGDLLITMGAGNIVLVGENLIK